MDLEWSAFKDKRICVAVSGGADSTALLHYLKANEKALGYRLCAVNFEHGIRGEESVQDSLFVQKICKEWEVDLYCYAEDCPARAREEKTSLETAARNFRNEKYEELLKAGKADVIATAHHANDVAETVLFRLSRGSALSGAAAIKKYAKGRLRPFLSWTKTEILRYVAENKLPYREDSTNFQTDATRNALRLQVLPLIEDRIPSAVKNIARFAATAEEDDAFLYELAETLLIKNGRGYTVRFSDKKPIFTRACLRAMKLLGVEKDYTQTHLNDLFSLQGLCLGAMLTMPKGVFAKRESDGIFFYNKCSEQPQGFEPHIFSEGSFTLGRYAICISKQLPIGEIFGKILRFDADKLPPDCVVRSREEGDFFEKFGGGTKTLKRYLIDKKIPKEMRDLPLIAMGKEIYAIFGVEISEKIKIDAETKNPLYLTIKFTGDEEI